NNLVISSPGASCPSTPGSEHAEFTGTASVIRSIGPTTEPFTVKVDDCGEPGSADTFSIKTTTYANGGTLIGGNIQVHPAVAPIPAGLKDNIQHVIVLMQENRSFDDYLGQLPAFDPTLDVEPEPAT